MWKLNRRSVSLVETATMNQATLPRDRGTVFLVVLLPVTVRKCLVPVLHLRLKSPSPLSYIYTGPSIKLNW